MRNTRSYCEDDVDEDDARMRFKVSDNIAPMQATLSIQGDDDNKITPGQAITFICTITGGAPPFEYNFMPRCPKDHSVISEVKEERSFEKKFSYINSDHGYYNPYIYVNGELGLRGI